MSLSLIPNNAEPQSKQNLLSYQAHNPRANMVSKDFIFESTHETDLTTDTASDSESNSEPLDSTELSIFHNINSYYDIKRTTYGGRGCFASTHIPKDTVILQTGRPVGSAIAKAFKKEVCTWCFAYHDGKTMKHKLQNKIYFCSESCLSEFCKDDTDGLLTKALISFDDVYAKNECQVDDYDLPEDFEDASAFRENTWSETLKWDLMISKTKATKRARFIPKLSKDDYAEAKYVISVLHTLNQGEQGPLAKELELFETLESSEQQKVKKYPYLSTAYSNIFKFLRITCPEAYQKFITPTSVCDIIGRNLTNAFGIWSPTLAEDEEREYLGFGVYPSASFFNHACSFNVKKTRQGGSYTFTTTQDILPGEELCISYGISKDDDLKTREAALAEWFFKCGCSRCVKERDTTSI